MEEILQILNAISDNLIFSCTHQKSNHLFFLLYLNLVISQYLVQSEMKKLCFAFLLFVVAKSIISPYDFIKMAVQGEKSSIYAKSYNMGRTVNNNQLTIFTVTKYPYSSLTDLKGREAILINSYMHAREPYSLHLAFKLYQNLIKNKMIAELSTFLERGVFIFYPFVNADGYQQYTKPTSNKQYLRKNMNKVDQNCRGGLGGVDINRNFDSSFGSVPTSTDPCNQQYRGVSPFSEKESQVFRQIFMLFNVVLAIDIHSYGNEWIYPYASDASQQKIKKHRLYNIYTQVVGSLRSQNFTIRSCFESLNYIADGVYIDWALDQGAFSLAYQVGKTFSYDSNIKAQIQRSLKQFDIVFEFLGAWIEGRRVGQIIELKSKSLLSLQINATFDNNTNYQPLKPGQIKYLSIPRDAQQLKVSVGNETLLSLEFSPSTYIMDSKLVIILVLMSISLLFLLLYSLRNVQKAQTRIEKKNVLQYQNVNQVSPEIKVTQMQM